MEREYKYRIPTVSLGGGTGHYGYLTGAVKLNYPEFNTAIPATWDGKGRSGNGGGSSGELRVAEGILPPGDYMQCLFALMEDDDQRQAAITILRDRKDVTHPLVNLIAASAEKNYHGVQDGIEGLRSLLRVRGRIALPSLVDLTLIAKTKNGKIIAGEGDIDHKKHDDGFHLEDEVSRIYFDTKATANPLALEAIRRSKKTVITAGSPFTSIFPHLLVDGVAESIKESDAQLVIIFNLMNTAGEDHHLNQASRWLQVFQYYLGDKEYITQFGRSRINYLVGHDHQYSDPEVIDHYAREGQSTTIIDEDLCKVQAPGLRVVRKNLARYDKASHLFRHDPVDLAETVFSLYSGSLVHSTDQRTLQAVVHR